MPALLHGAAARACSASGCTATSPKETRREHCAAIGRLLHVHSNHQQGGPCRWPTQWEPLPLDSSRCCGCLLLLITRLLARLPRALPMQQAALRDMQHVAINRSAFFAPTAGRREQLKRTGGCVVTVAPSPHCNRHSSAC